MSTNVHVLNVEERTDLGTSSSRRYRRDGKVLINFNTAACENKFYVADARDWVAIDKAQANLIQLKLENGDVLDGLIGEVQKDYLKCIVLHIDIKETQEDKAIEAKVPLHPFGSPIGLGKGGMFEQIAHTILVKALPANLPAEIKVDVSGMDINEKWRAHQVALPEGVEAVRGERYFVFGVVPTRASRSAGTTEEEEA